MQEFKSFFKCLDNRKFNTWCKYTTMLDVYGCGCAFDCKYCYAKSLLSFRKFWNPEKPKVAYITEIEKAISLLSKNTVVRLGCMTDCFQPIEKKYNVTYETIKLLNKYKINYLIVTKSNTVSEEKYINIYDKKLSHFQISVTTTSDKKCKKYEGAPVVSKRIKAIERLYKLGFDVSIRLSPFISENIDFDILNSINCDKILVEFLKVNHFVKKSFDFDYKYHVYKYGGYENLTLEEKIKRLKSITDFEQITVGEYVKEHYEYFKKHVNYNKNDCCNLDLNLPEYLNGEQFEMEFK